MRNLDGFSHLRPLPGLVSVHKVMLYKLSLHHPSCIAEGFMAWNTVNEVVKNHFKHILKDLLHYKTQTLPTKHHEEINA